MSKIASGDVNVCDRLLNLSPWDGTTIHLLDSGVLRCSRPKKKQKNEKLKQQISALSNCGESIIVDPTILAHEMPKSVFRPCIDLHHGQVKQIVGGSLSDQEPSELKTNFVAS